jgi:hypothetical protein
MVRELFSQGVSVMRFVSKLKSLAMAGAAASLLAASGALAQDFDQPFFGGAYIPGPSYTYDGGYASVAGVGVGVGGIGIGVGVAAVGYDTGYYNGGYQYPAGGYGGGPYRRAAYSAADVYVTPVVARTVWRPVVRTHYVPVTVYRPVRRNCHCGDLY